MCFVKMYFIFLSTLLFFKNISAQNCTVSEVTFNLTVLTTFDGTAESTNSTGVIKIDHDAFGLTLANNSVQKICEGMVHITEELSVIQILNSSVQDIEAGAFKILPTLALLKISLNNIKTISTGVFTSLRVKEIDLSNNFIRTIEENAFDNITTLEIVTLNYNNLKVINPNWFQNTNIYKLDAIYNEIPKLEANAFKNLVTTRPMRLFLSANRLWEIDPDAFHGHHVIDIFRFNGNKISQLPANLFVNRTIKNIHVNTNELKCFPQEMFQNSVETLEFTDNMNFDCDCLEKVRKFVENNRVKVLYPSIICEDKSREVNVVYNVNRTYEIPVIRNV